MTSALLTHFRPWVESPKPPSLKETIVESIPFPEEDESMGEITIAMFGPDCNDVVETAALTILLTYLAGSSVSVLENIMVEKEELASAIYHNWDARPNSVIWFQPSGVATEKLADVEKRLFEILKDVASKPLDMKYMLDCISRERRQVKFQAESSGSFYADGIINDFLFGKRDGSTLKDLSSIAEFDELEKWTDEQWRAFLRKWISDAPHISLLGTPSKDLSEKMKASEEKRLATRREELGPDGLAKLGEKLKAAVAKNDIEIPASLLQKWPVPGVESIHFIETTSARSGLAKKLGTPANNIQKIVDQTSNLPLFLQFEHVPTNFVHLTMLIGTSKIETEHRPLLPLFMDNFFNTPIMRGGKKIEFEEVVTLKRLKKLLASEPETVIGWLEALRTSLFTFDNMRTLVIANVEKLPNPVDAWKPLVAGLDTTKPLLPLVKLDERLSPDGQKPGNYGAVVVPMPTIDSSFLLSSAKGPKSHTDPVLPALMVAISFLDQVEGPIWTAVRGTGLAYGASFRHDPDGGFVQFSVYRSPDAYRAFTAAKGVLDSYINGSAKFEQYALEGAVSQIVTGLADEQSTMAAAGQFHFVDSVVKGVADDYNEKLLKQVRAVTVDEIKSVMSNVLLPLFVPGKANVVVTCAPIMVEGIVKGFTDAGFKAQSQPLSAFQESYGLEADEDEDEEMEDVEEEGESGEDSDEDDE